MATKLNLWNEAQVKRAESTWGHTVHPYSEDLFNFAIKSGDSFLDLGCGFGRFLEYLINNHPNKDFEYIGYDSSPEMIERTKERFPDYSSRLFVKDITLPIRHTPKVVISSAVFIHLASPDQVKILKNLSVVNSAVAIGLDINCLSPSELGKETFTEKHLRIGTGTFRMAWQDRETFEKRLVKNFPNFSVSHKAYPLAGGRFKTMFFLTKKGTYIV